MCSHASKARASPMALDPALASPSLWQLIDRRAESTPDALLAVDQRGREISFFDLRERALRAARGLADLGIAAGQTVSWMLPTRIETLVLIGALSRLGAVQNPILPIYRDREVRFIADQCHPTLLITPSEWRGFDYARMAQAIAAERDDLTTIVVDDGLAEIDRPLDPAESAQSAESIDTTSDDPIRWIFYTSGTTAEPKGVQHTDGSLYAASMGMSRALALSAADRVAFVFPVTHIGGLNWLQAGFAHGCTQILIEHFAAPDTIPTLQAKGVTLAAAGTIFHEAYLAAQRSLGTTPLFPNVRAFPGGGAPKPPKLHRALKAEMGGLGILSGYGSTEAPIVTMSSVDDPDTKLAATEGRPSRSDVDLIVVKEDESRASAGEEGELRVRGPQVFRGYVDARLDREAFDANGYFRTGDLGRLDDAGYLVVTGRLKDIIIRKGENIPAREVEDLLYTHPKIADVAVIGLPDQKTGERACAVLVCANSADPIDAAEVDAFLRSRQLLVQRIPEQVEIVDEIPRNATGKVMKHVLRERFGPAA